MAGLSVIVQFRSRRHSSPAIKGNPALRVAGESGLRRSYLYDGYPGLPGLVEVMVRRSSVSPIVLGRVNSTIRELARYRGDLFTANADVVQSVVLELHKSLNGGSLVPPAHDGFGHP